MNIDLIKEMWDSRYAATSYAYGIHPNAFFKEIIDQQKNHGKILFPAEGEGRNAVYAAKLGWDSVAFDISEKGKLKAIQLAEQNNVSINYQVGEFFNLPIVHESFDAAALIYAHLPLQILSTYYQKTAELIKPGGLIILEGFSKGNLPFREANPAIGGPNTLDMLFSTQEIEAYFPNFKIIQLEEKEVLLDEGEFHQGKGKVIRFVGKKK